ncbi:MAG: L-aspartate oxidase [Calditrichaeota bacterium]|nr:L-aspartate oxidase [Calditrichota bacterium]
MSDHIETEVLIIGCGIAGGLAALRLADSGVPVTVVTHGSNTVSSSTYYAQGGIIYKGEKDSPDLLAEDIFRAGAGHSYPPAVKKIAEEGPELVEKLLVERLQIQFDRNPDGTFALAREGGHSVPRILHVRDSTGKSIQDAIMIRIMEHPNILLLENQTAIDLLTPAHHSRDRRAVYEPSSCVGAYLFNQKERRVIRVLAKKTVLATGGLGQIFKRSTNPPGSRGDGIAMAHRAGARIVNMEFIQFHPTIFYHEYRPTFLISEAVRGAGARLVDAHGRPFMQKYAAEWKDLAPRDLVACSIHKEMLEQDMSHVYLDMRSYLSADRIKNEFPFIYQKCMEFGVDPTKDLIPVVPAAHYLCGGVLVNEDGESSLQNLYAVGEVACTGVHGANRLASTSLLEGVVWANSSANHILQNLKETKPYDSDNIPEWKDIGEFEPDPALISQDMSSIRNIMWNYVGLVRTTHRLQRARRDLRNLENEIERFYRVSKLSDGLIGLRNAVRTAIIVTSSAWENTQSMGCHYRE